MNALTKILSVAGAAACLATPLAASAQPDGFHHDWRGRDVHEHVWRGREWRGHDWRVRGGWGPAFYGVRGPVIYDAPDYPPAPVVYERQIVERPVVEHVYERTAIRPVRVVHRLAHRVVRRAVACAVPAHRR